MTEKKINEAMLKAIEIVKPNGISPEDKAYLEAQGVKDELLKELSGTTSAKQVDDVLMGWGIERTNNVNKPQQAKKKGFWQSGWGTALKAIGATVALGALCYFGAPLLVSAASTLAGKTLLGIGGVALLGLGATSCINITQENYDASDVETNDKLDEISKKLDASNENDEIKIELLRQAINLLKEGNGSLDDIIAKLTEIGFKEDKIYEELLAQGYDKKELAAKFSAQLDVLINQNSEANGHLKDIKEILGEHTKALDKLNQNDTEGLALADKIFVKLTELADKGIQVDPEVKQLLVSILQNIQNFNADSKAALLEIINKLDTYGADTKGLLLTIIDNQSRLLTQGATMSAELQASIKNSTDAILSAIASGKTVAQGTFDTVNKIYAAINKINTPQIDIDTTKIEQLLASLLDSVNTSIKNNQAYNEKTHALIQTVIDKIDGLSAVTTQNNEDVVNAINKLGGKVDAGTQVSTSILDAVNKLVPYLAGLGDDIVGRLDAILAKIPAACTGHDCECDPAEIIARLEVIIQKMENKNHEGILGDLDGLEDALG